MEGIKKLLGYLNSVVNSNELSAALAASDLSAVEWTDEGLDEIKGQVGKLMTPEAASANAAVLENLRGNRSFIDSILEKEKGQIQSGILESIKNDHLAPIATKLGVNIADTDKLADVAAKIKEVDIQAVDPKQVELINQLKADREKLSNELKEIGEKHQNELQEKDRMFARRELMDTIKAKCNEYKWLDVLDADVRNSIIESKVAEVESRAIMKLEEGEVKFYQKDLPDNELYENGKDKATFDSMFTPKFEPYIQKSNGQPEPKPDSTPGKMVDTVVNPLEDSSTNYIKSVQLQE